MKIMMLSCEQAALLGAKASISGLSLIEKVKAKMHMKMCAQCEQYQKNNQLIDKAIDKIIKEQENDKIKLTDTQKEKIRKVIC